MSYFLYVNCLLARTSYSCLGTLFVSPLLPSDDDSAWGERLFSAVAPHLFDALPREAHQAPDNELFSHPVLCV